MNKEEIRHFKSLLRQGSLRHMNILLDDKFQKELLNIIKNYEQLQKQNTELKKENFKLQARSDRFINYWNKLKEWAENYLDGARSGLDSYDCGIGDCLDDLLRKMQEIVGGMNE